MKAKLVVCAGDAGVDAYHLPTGLVERPGGCALNVAVNLKHHVAGAHVLELASNLGDDADSAIARAAIERHGLGRYARTIRGRSPRQDIRVHPDGEKDFFEYEPGAVVDSLFDADQRAVLERADWVTAVLYAQDEAFVRRLVALPRRGKLALDFMTMRDFGMSLARVRPLYDAADLAFFGLDPQDALIDELRADARRTGRTTIVTLGPSGSRIFHGGREIHTPAPAAARVIDTTGAGDNFLAAFLAASLAGEPPEAAAVFAHAAATRSVDILGAFE